MKICGYKKIIPFLLIFFFGCGVKEPVNDDMHSLLQTWCDGLLQYQLNHESEAFHGGILCPACGIMHGRSADAVYPLFYVAEQTGDKKYSDAAVKLFNWAKHNVSFPDGSWSNEVNLSDWRGITVFGLIALAETYHHFSHLMDETTKAEWYACIKEQADFIEHYIKPGVGSINYSASACYALALSSEITGNQSYMQRAAELAKIVPAYFTPNNYFVYGEGEYPYEKSPKGLLPVDLGYNVEETLPNLLFYADMVNNMELKQLIKRSMDSHIEFMLPDGAWDNSWGTRNFKWTYWGSRTSDGVLPLCGIFAKEDPVYAEIGYRNFELLKKFTPKNLLYGGAHYVSAGYAPCVHHTFEHAKSLAVALNKGFEKPQERIDIPRDNAYGAKHFKDLDVWNIAHKAFRATVSGYDADYKMLAGNPHGGTLTMLWHEKTGPLLASGMLLYSCIEPANMQMIKGMHSYPGNMLIQYKENGKTYRSASYRDAKITYETTTVGEKITVKTGLETTDYQIPESGKIDLQIVYEFVGDEFTMRINLLNPHNDKELELFIPLISHAGEEFSKENNTYIIQKESSQISISSDKELKILPVETNGRAFLPVPGFEFIPFQVKFKQETTIKLKCEK